MNKIREVNELNFYHARKFEVEEGVAGYYRLKIYCLSPRKAGGTWYVFHIFGRELPDAVKALAKKGG